MPRPRRCDHLRWKAAFAQSVCERDRGMRAGAAPAALSPESRTADLDHRASQPGITGARLFLHVAERFGADDFTP